MIPRPRQAETPSTNAEPTTKPARLKTAWVRIPEEAMTFGSTCRTQRADGDNPLARSIRRYSLLSTRSMPFSQRAVVAGSMSVTRAATPTAVLVRATVRIHREEEEVEDDHYDQGGHGLGDRVNQPLVGFCIPPKPGR